jgi:Ring finger domain
MSTAASNSVNFNLATEDSERDNVKLGLSLVGIVLLFLFTMVALKLCCNIIIDVVILRDGDSLMRTVSQLRRTVCPWWHPRTEPTTPQSGENNSVPSQQRSAVNVRVDMENLLVGMTPAQKKQLLAAILPCKAVTEQDVATWKTDISPVKGNSEVRHNEEAGTQKPSHDTVNNTLCPICIHDICVGDSICYSGLCHHVFHRDCLSAWLSTHSRICPYCRQEILTQEMLEEAHRIKLEWLDVASEDSDGMSISSGEESMDSLDC